MYVSAESVILHSIKYSDTSRIVTVYSKEFGKLTFIAKGARSSKSKFGSSLDTLSYSRLYFNRIQGKELFTLTNAELIKPFNDLHDSYDHLSVGLMLTESLYITQDKDAPNWNLFDCLIGNLTFLNELPVNAFSVFIRFQLQLANEMGFGMDLLIPDNSNTAYFITLDNGTIYEQKPAGIAFIKIEADLLRKLVILNSNESTNERPDFDKNEMRSFAEFFAAYFSFHLDKKVFYKTLNLLMI